jgi:hypothetical protein
MVGVGPIAWAVKLLGNSETAVRHRAKRDLECHYT